MGKLENKRHERFCHEMLVDGNATQAYIRTGYSENGARVSASQLLSNPNIVSRIEELRVPILQECKMDLKYAMGVLKELIDYGTSKDEYDNMKDASAVNSAIDKVLRVNAGYAAEKVDHNIKTVKIIDFAGGAFKKDDDE